MALANGRGLRSGVGPVVLSAPGPAPSRTNPGSGSRISVPSGPGWHATASRRVVYGLQGALIRLGSPVRVRMLEDRG
jgi:hypothetical protein